MEIAKKVAENLLKIKAVFLRPDEPFIWASGIKSPIYCDNRLILTAPEARDVVENAIAETVKKEYPDAQALFGTSTATGTNVFLYITGILLNRNIKVTYEALYFRHFTVRENTNLLILSYIYHLRG